MYKIVAGAIDLCTADLPASRKLNRSAFALPSLLAANPSSWQATCLLPIITPKALGSGAVCSFFSQGGAEFVVELPK
jgi:hypothetical protein